MFEFIGNSVSGPGHHISQIIGPSIKERAPYDDTCVLKAGEHPFIKHDSYVLYRQAKIESERRLKKQVDSGVMTPKEAVSDELLTKIIQGLKGSIHTKRFIKKLL